MDHNLTPDETAALQRDQFARELDDLRQRFERGGTVLILPEGAVLQVVTVDASEATVSVGRVGDRTGGEG